MVSYVSIDNMFFSLTSPDDKDGSPPAKIVSRSSLTLHLHSPSGHHRELSMSSKRIGVNKKLG